MTPLRQRMLNDMQLHSLSPKTQEAYTRAVRQLAAHYGKSPDQICEEELRDYFLYLKNEKKVSRSASTVALCGIKFFFHPCYAIVSPGHGYRSDAAFWPIDPSGNGKTSEPTLQLGLATVIIPGNTGKWALGNPP